MTQSNNESKMNSPKVVSRDFSVKIIEEKSRPNQSEKKNISTPQSETEQILSKKVGRREVFAAMIPASSKAFAGFLRDLRLEFASVLEDLKDTKRRR